MSMKSEIADNIELTKESALQLIGQYLNIAQSKGAFVLRDAYFINAALEYFDPEVKKKNRKIMAEKNPERSSWGILLQAINVAQKHKDGSWGLKDAALLYEVAEFLQTNSLDESAPKSKMVKNKASASSIAFPSITEEDDDEEESDEDSLPVRKGKQKPAAN